MTELNPKYWYIDSNGVVKKYIYCKLCHAGPFKEIEEELKFKFLGVGFYCISCSSIHNEFKSESRDHHRNDVKNKSTKELPKECDTLELD
jgi:hypothetical protein